MKNRRTEQPAENAENQSDWVKTPVANLVRYKPSGIYFARLRIRGKLFRHYFFGITDTTIELLKDRVCVHLKQTLGPDFLGKGLPPVALQAPP
jgi:hypothetical protein